MQNIVYIGEFDFTRKNASSLRVQNIARALMLTSKVNISLIGYSNTKKLKIESLQIINAKKGYNTLSKLFNFLTRPWQFIALLKKMPKVDIVIYYGTSSLILNPLFRYCKKNNIKIVVDVVEWYDYSSLPLGRLGPFALNTHLAMTRLIPKCDGVIVISNYLKEYFSTFKIKIIHIPVLVDTTLNHNSDVSKEFRSEYLNLIYAGTPGKKDLLLNMMNAVDIVANMGKNIRFHILGSTEKDIIKLKRKISENIICHGKIRQEDVSSYLEKADFSVLLRPNKRYANAGFPTKFVESLNEGLPVIANLTSDLGKYLIDDYNGYIVQSYDERSLVDKLQFIIAIAKRNQASLKANARKTAVEQFDYRLFSNRIYTFIVSL